MPQLNNDAIILEMKATTKEGVLRELAALGATKFGPFTVVNQIRNENHNSEQH